MLPLAVFSSVGLIAVAVSVISPNTRHNAFNLALALACLGTLAMVLFTVIEVVTDSYKLGSVVSIAAFLIFSAAIFVFFNGVPSRSSTGEYSSMSVPVERSSGNQRAKAAVELQKLSALHYLGLAGAVVLLAGTFAPVVSVPIIGSMHLFSSGVASDAVYLAAISIVTVVLVFLRKLEWLPLLGAAALGLVIYFLSGTLRGLNLAQTTQAEQITPQEDPWGIAAGIGALFDEAFRFRLGWGWVPLFAGALLILGVGVTAWRQSQKVRKTLG
jgi:hypothetical protein